MKTSELPEYDRLVNLKCFDWSKYRCVGKRVKTAKGLGWAFMVKLHDGSFKPNMNAWRDCEDWEYAEGEAK